LGGTIVLASSPPRMIHRGPAGLSIPDESLTDALLRRARDFGERAAFIDGTSGRALSFRDFVRAVQSAAAGLARRGLQKGDVLALLAPNSLEYPLAFHAAVHAGGIATTINPLSTCEEIRRQLADSGARFLVTSDALADKAVEAARGTAVERLFTT